MLIFLSPKPCNLGVQLNYMVVPPYNCQCGVSLPNVCVRLLNLQRANFYFDPTTWVVWFLQAYYVTLSLFISSSFELKV